VRRLVFLVSLGAALLLAPVASAKMCIRIATVPAQPVAGAMTTIRVTALVPVAANGTVGPGRRTMPVPADMRVNLRISRAGAQPRVVTARRLADRASVLEVRFAFPTAGTWTVRWAAFPDGNAPSCAGWRNVRVGGR
jgi:hypothetical protein